MYLSAKVTYLPVRFFLHFYAILTSFLGYLMVLTVAILDINRKNAKHRVRKIKIYMPHAHMIQIE